jgi:hypothetical protein
MSTIKAHSPFKDIEGQAVWYFVVFVMGSKGIVIG